MKTSRGFDEVMIVNPYDPLAGCSGEGETHMPYHYAEPPEMGFYAEGPETYGYYAEDPYGYYAEPAELAGWGEPDVYGEVDPSYAEYEPVGYYAEEYPYGEVDPYGYYAEPPEVSGWGEYEPVGYYAEEPLYGAYGEYPELAWGEPDIYGEYEPMGWYGEVPEMVGYDEYEPLAEDYPTVGEYGEPDISGYVRDVPPTFNAGCPLPTNVAGFGEGDHLEGYVRPVEVSPTCERFTPQPGPTPGVPETFRPLW